MKIGRATIEFPPFLLSRSEFLPLLCSLGAITKVVFGFRFELG